MAFAVDDLHVLPCDLVLLALALIQQVQGVHFFLHCRFFEELGLQIKQRQAVELGQKCGRNQYQAHARILQCGHQRKKLENEHAAQQTCAEQLPRADTVEAFIGHQPRSGIPHKNTDGKGKADLPQHHGDSGQGRLLQAGFGRDPNQQTPQFIDRFRRKHDPNAAVSAGSGVQRGTQFCRNAHPQKEPSINHQQHRGRGAPAVGPGNDLRKGYRGHKIQKKPQAVVFPSFQRQPIGHLSQPDTKGTGQQRYQRGHYSAPPT